MAPRPGDVYGDHMGSTGNQNSPPHRGVAGTALGTVFGALWSAPGRRATMHVLLGLPIGLASFTVTVILIALTGGFLITAVLAVVTLVLLLWSVRGFTALQRSRFRALLGVEIPPVSRRYEGTWLQRLLAEARAGSTWRQICYHLLALVIGTVGYAVVTVAWSAGIAMSLLVGYGWALPHQGLFGWDLHSPTRLATLTVPGLGLLLAAPWVARAIAWVDVQAARALLGPSRSRELSKRVESLTRSRAHVVDAADAERRRIERDLHDGAQQRLVSLAMNLGMARANLTDAPGPARQAIENAHDEAKQALAELRDFVRGLHPAVLNDRGLDAALSGVVARTPLPVRLRVDVAQRCSPTIEAIAYFVVSEALTNVAKHAHASEAAVVVERTGDRLRITVTDNGRGAAAPEGGSGLRGLAHRAASVDGTVRIDSPPGGPTVIVVELPCDS